MLSLLLLVLFIVKVFLQGHYDFQKREAGRVRELQAHQLGKYRIQDLCSSPFRADEASRCGRAIVEESIWTAGECSLAHTEDSTFMLSGKHMAMQCTMMLTVWDRSVLP